ncbi:LysR family transcriptional regulator [Stackebrandtia nassauensis]|uniref:Transcriptional regulator, LysR family n=1 Tax=Stackebrandtia nassauensis (strain DSM 44728 / CIP 108903 / NRRL B-16338 / NBRC 102104 / LLR-40K-21) TaxID=446470 RepID=D3Q8M7_STANL|nr:LysR family transcriptional regulator [Stackebrandtia nassauensis]ADD44469.1 transcriptional regulator, LysR family [Stackebrandtia nassauensis DSM 44728]
MDVRQLEYFLAVVDNGGFNRAAKALYLAQPSLSQAIRTLERDLGSMLFHRIGRGVVLTEAGRALVEPARQAVRSLELARASIGSVTGLRTGRVDIAAMPSQAVEPLSGMVERFSHRHPGMSVSIKSAPWPRVVTEMVHTGIAELGLLAAPEPVVDADLKVHDLGRHRFVLISAPDGPFAPGTVVTPAKLSGQRVIAGQPGTGMRRYIDDLKADGLDLTIAVETEHREAILPLVLRGVGSAVLTEAWTTLAEKSGALVLELEPAAYLHVALVSRADRLTPAAAEFLKIATDG